LLWLGKQKAGPHNIRGIEINEYAAELARVTVWIGDIQWCRRNGREIARNPILRALDGIEHRDALIESLPHPDPPPPGEGAFSSTQRGEVGRGEFVEAPWPTADVIIGNPPFLGDKMMRGELGDAYVETLRKCYEGRVPGGADLVTYWFEKARAQLTAGQAAVAGFVTTNSIRGGSNRKVLQRICESGSIFNAWSDEPWINDGAAVRVSLVCFGPVGAGFKPAPTKPAPTLNGLPVSEIYADLTGATAGAGLVPAQGCDLTKAIVLAENKGVSFIGTQKNGPFDVPGEMAREWLKVPNPNGRPTSDVVRPWVNGMDITRRPSDTWIIDFGNMDETSASLYEVAFGHVVKHVKPDRILNRREIRARNWWRHGEVMPLMRTALQKVERYIITPRVSKHRIFTWVLSSVLPDCACSAIARQDDTTFGILHSRFHELWSLRMCTWLGKGNDPRYTPTTCFETFPFPAGVLPLPSPPPPGEGAISSTQRGEVGRGEEAIATAAVTLNKLRENWLNPPEWVEWVITPQEEKAGYPKRPVAKPGHESDLKKRTLTNLYNSRPAWLDNAHKALDKAVAAAYGWPDDLTDDEILSRLLSLNMERAVKAC
jgi:type II restriction/modification system DNA methylase subunit YeeA